MASNDVINHPSHYCDGRRYEPIDVIEDWKLNYNRGNIIKYCSRAGRKDNELEDMKKCAWYANREVERLERANGIVENERQLFP